MDERTELQSARERLLAFVVAEREQLDDDTGNILATYAGQLADLLSYLEVTASDYAKAAEVFFDNVERRKAIQDQFGPGTRRVGAEELQLMEAGREAAVIVHLRIGTVYLWAKVLLDKLARLLPYHLGPARGVKLQKHSQLKRALPEFAEQKGLTVPPALTDLVDELTRRIVDYRDDLIVHAHNPRMWRATVFDPGKREASISTGLMYPRNDTELDPNSETPTT